MNFEYITDHTYLKVIPLVLNSEAGYANLKGDPGGPTMRGIAWNYNAAWLKANTNIQTPEDMPKLTKEQALWCYYERYWLPSGAKGLTDVDLAYEHLDAAVNCGVGQAQKFLSRLSINPKAFDFTDGKNRTLAMKLFLEYTIQRLSFYTHCKGRDRFLEGWVNRMVDVLKNSIGLE